MPEPEASPPNEPISAPTLIGGVWRQDGEWIELFHPQLLRPSGINDKDLVQPGVFHSERLVNMSKHNYVTGRGGVEPNGSITPDKRWVIFTGNFDGERHVYAVATARSN